MKNSFTVHYPDEIEEKDMKYECLELSKEELKSLENYVGPKGVQINSMMEDNFFAEIEKESHGWYISYDKLKQDIEMMVNLYSSLYKEMKKGRDGRSDLYREASKKEVSEFYKGKKINRFLSTTTDKTIDTSIKYQFALADDVAIEYVHLDETVPSLYINQYIDNPKENENEVLVSPFTKIVETSFVSKWKEIVYQSVSLTKEPFEKIEESELQELEKRIDTMGQQIEEAKKCEDIKTYKKIKQDLQLYIKGRCAQREIQVEEELEKEKRENEKKLEQVKIEMEKQQRKQQIDHMIEEIKGNKGKDIEKIEEMRKNIQIFNEEQSKYKQWTEFWGIKYQNENINEQVSKKLTELKKELQDKVNDLLVMQRQTSLEKEEMGEIKNQISKYQSRDEGLDSMTSKIQDVIQNRRNGKQICLMEKIDVKLSEMEYDSEKEMLKQQKDRLQGKHTFLEKMIDKITGEEKLREAKLRELELQEKWNQLKKEETRNNPSKSVEQVLKKAYGITTWTPEIEKYFHSVGNIGNVKGIVQWLQDIKNQKTQQLIPVDLQMSKRAEAKLTQERCDGIARQIQDKQMGMSRGKIANIDNTNDMSQYIIRQIENYKGVAAQENHNRVVSKEEGQIIE